MIRPQNFSSVSVQDKAQRVAAWLKEHKAHDLVGFDLKDLSTVTDLSIVCSGSSSRHVRSLAEGLMELCKQEGYEFLRLEGQQSSLWVLADLNDLVVHVFQSQVRELYNLEGLWRDAPRVDL